MEDTAYFQMRQRISDLLSSLTPEEQKLLTLRFGLEGSGPQSSEQVGLALGLTAAEVVAAEAKPWPNSGVKCKERKTMAKKIAIAIDGPAGAGKSTIARRLAAELGYCYVDTGAIYRTVAYFLDLLGISPKDADGVARYLDELTVGITYDEEGKQHMIMNGMDVTGHPHPGNFPEGFPGVRQPAGPGNAAGPAAGHGQGVQRHYGRRDIGTVVLPRANVKIFLTASPEVRAKRRTAELEAKGQTANYEKVLKEIQQRDYQDSHRAIAPLKQAKDAVKVDTSELDIDGVVAAIRKIVEGKIGQ